MSLNLDKSQWTRVRFGDVVYNVNDTVRDPESAGIDRVIAMEHMDPGNLSISRWGTLEDGTSFSRRVRPSQTLFGKRRAYQRKVAFAGFDAICSGDILTFEADESKMLAEFLPFLVQSDAFFGHALGTSAGSLSPRTNWRDLAKFEFDLPPLDEQRHVAGLLWAVERQRMEQIRLKVALEKAGAALLPFTASKVDATNMQLGDVLDVVLDRRGITPKKLGEDWADQGIPVLSAMNIVDGEIDRGRQERYVSENVARRWMKGWLKAGDILMTSEAPLGSTVLLAGDMEACIGQRLFALRPNPQKVLPEYLHAWLSSDIGQSALRERASGTTVKGIRQAELIRVHVPIPALQEQQEFVSVWNRLRETITSVNIHAAEVIRLRAALMAEIFGGP